MNRIHSKLRKLDLDDAFIEAYMQKLRRNNESYITASKVIDRWEKSNSGQFILQALVCGLIAAFAGSCLAVVQSLR